MAHRALGMWRDSSSGTWNWRGALQHPIRALWSAAATPSLPTILSGSAAFGRCDVSGQLGRSTSISYVCDRTPANTITSKRGGSGGIITSHCERYLDCRILGISGVLEGRPGISPIVAATRGPFCSAVFMTMERGARSRGHHMKPVIGFPDVKP